MKRTLAVRKRYRAFSRGAIEFLHPENRKVLTFVRRWEDQRILVVVNLSRFVQAVELDLSEFRDTVPVEVFGQTEFPPIGDPPYFLTLGPHAFYWFEMGSARIETEPPAVDGADLPVLSVDREWANVLTGKAVAQLEGVLPRHLKGRRWFAGQARAVLSCRILEALPLRPNGSAHYITLVRVDYRDGDPDVYQIPMTFSAGQRANEILEHHRHAAIARLRVRGKDGELDGILHDAVVEEEFAATMLSIIEQRRRRKGATGTLCGARTRKLRAIRGPSELELPASPLGAEQRNTSLVYGDRLILKLFRRLHPGVNPDLEIGRFLTERTNFQNVSRVAGAVSYEPERGESQTLALLQEYVPHEGDAWTFTQDALERYFEDVLSRPAVQRRPDGRGHQPLARLDAELPRLATETIGPYLEFARLLGQRTAELHVALASRSDDPEMVPEPFTPMFRRSLYQTSRTRADRALELLKKRLTRLPEEVHADARHVLGLRDLIDQRLRAVVDQKVRGMRIRCHCDYHLGQVLFTGKDFVIMDFEGDPARPISERRLKRSPLRDVGGMLRSFHHASLFPLVAGRVRPEDVPVLEPWARDWYLWVAVDFLRAYLDAVARAALLPERDEELMALLDTCLLDKALDQLAHQLEHRPASVIIPLRGIADLIEASAANG